MSETMMLREAVGRAMALRGMTYHDIAEAAAVPLGVVKELMRSRERKTIRNDYRDRLWALAVDWRRHT